MRYSENMSSDEEDALLAYMQYLDDAYASCDLHAVDEGKEEEGELADPIYDGWVDKAGRP